MQIKVYCPKLIDIPSEYLPALVKRAVDAMGDRAGDVVATRGHLVRQAVLDGLLRELDHLVAEDGTVDLVCDPGMEVPLEVANETLTLARLLDVLQYKRPSDSQGDTNAWHLHDPPSRQKTLDPVQDNRQGHCPICGTRMPNPNNN